MNLPRNNEPTWKAVIAMDYDYRPYGCDGNPLPESRECYEENGPYSIEGRNMDYAEYVQTYGDPDNYEARYITLYIRRNHAWEYAGSLCGIDNYLPASAWQSLYTGEVYGLDDPLLDDYARDVIGELISEYDYTQNKGA